MESKALALADITINRDGVQSFSFGSSHHCRDAIPSKALALAAIVITPMESKPWRVIRKCCKKIRAMLRR
jgi:hypothetical protein